MTKLIAFLLCACGLLTSCGQQADGDAIQNTIEQMNWRIAEIQTTVSEYNKDAAHIYYVSTSGNDKNDGLSPETPLASPQGANKLAQEGDVVLFKRGDEWRVRWPTKAGVTYSAYGEGPKPIFNGNKYGNAADPSHWTLVEGTENVWKYKEIIPDVGCIVFNEGEYVGLKLRPEVHEKKFHIWTVKGFEPFEFNNRCFKQDLSFVSEYVYLATNGADAGTPARLYLRCDSGNPGDVYDSIEIMYRGNVISAKSGVTLDNLCVKYTGGHGIGAGTVENLTIRNCEVGWIGGSAQYFTNHYMICFGNGIEVYGGCKNYTVDNCYVYQCYDAGITHQYSNGGGENPVYHETVRFTNNVIEKCIYDIEFFLGRTDSGKIDIRVMKDVLYKGNILAYSGEGWGYDPSRAAGIKGWDNNNHTENFVVEENVFLLNKTDAWHIGADKEEWIPTFRNNTYIHRAKERFIRLGRPYNGKYTSIPMPFQEKYIEKVFEFIGETGSKCYFVDPKA